MTDIGEWYKRMPVFTKYWLSLTVGLTLLAKLNIVGMMQLILSSHFIFKKFQIWRIFTALFFYPIGGGNGFHFMFNCYFLYNYSNRLETDHYKQSPGDYFFLLIFNWLCCVIIGLVIDLPVRL